MNILALGPGDQAKVKALAELARDKGCHGMFVLTDDDNLAALATYQSAGAVREADKLVMLNWPTLP